jgi:hypothetical protein
MKFVRFGPSLVFCAMLAACGSNTEQAASNDAGTDGAPTAATASTDPCALVTTEEMAAIIGEKVTGTEPGDGECKYKTEDDASTVTIALDQSDAADAMRVARQAAGALSGIGGAVADEGGAGADVNAMLSDQGETPRLGEESFFSTGSQLNILKGNSYLAISPPIMRNRMGPGNPMLSSDDKKMMAVKIAETALARLP